MITALCSVVWMTRLGTFLFMRISRDGKDARFDAIKQNWLSFLGAWTLQAAWVVLTQLPVLMLNSSNDAKPVGWIDALALLAWAVGFFFEFKADLEKFTFRGDPNNKDKFITSGVWALSQHPNYFGEICM